MVNMKHEAPDAAASQLAKQRGEMWGVKAEKLLAGNSDWLGPTPNHHHHHQTALRPAKKNKTQKQSYLFSPSSRHTPFRPAFLSWRDSRGGGQSVEEEEKVVVGGGGGGGEVKLIN